MFQVMLRRLGLYLFVDGAKVWLWRTSHTSVYEQENVWCTVAICSTLLVYEKISLELDVRPFYGHE